jgi:hypothetical protein
MTGTSYILYLMLPSPANDAITQTFGSFDLRSKGMKLTVRKYTPLTLTD